MKKVVTYIILTAFLFGTMEIALKIAGSTFDSIQLTFLRFLIGGLVLAPFGVAEIRKDNIKITKGDWLWLLLVGIMGIAISMLAFQIGVQHCNASTAAALICLNPLFTMVIAHFFTSEKMDKAKGLAFFIGIVAAVFMIRPWDVQPGNTVFGMGTMLLASVTFAAYTVMGKKNHRPNRYFRSDQHLLHPGFSGVALGPDSDGTSGIRPYHGAAAGASLLRNRGYRSGIPVLLLGHPLLGCHHRIHRILH